MHRIITPLILICLLFGLAVKGNTMSSKPPKGSTAPAVQSPSATQSYQRILLNCPTGMPDGDALCQALIKALQQRAPGHDVQPSRRAPAAGELAIALHISRHDKHTLEGFLTWQTSTGGQQQGPPITLGADDTSIAPHMFPNFASGLIQLSKLPIS